MGRRKCLTTSRLSPWSCVRGSGHHDSTLNQVSRPGGATEGRKFDRDGCSQWPRRSNVESSWLQKCSYTLGDIARNNELRESQGYGERRGKNRAWPKDVFPWRL